MSDGSVPQGVPGPGDAGPLVPPDLLPSVEQPAYRRPAPLWQSASVVLVTLALLCGIGLGAARVNDRWGDAAQAATAAEGFHRLVSGDADAFLALVVADVRPHVKRADIEANRELGRTLEWEAPHAEGGAIVLEARVMSSPLAVGTATFTPDPDRGDLVRMVTSGPPFGEASGTIQLVRTLDGWRITGYAFHGFVEPTSTPGP